MAISHKVIFGILLGVIAFFSLYRLTESPPVWYDEGIYIQTAAYFAETGTLGFQLAPDETAPISYVTVGYPFIFPLALVFKIFGVGVLQARLLMVFFILSLAFVSYSLVRRLFGETCALWTLAVLSVFPPLYGNGKSVLGELPGVLYLSLFLLFLESAKRSGSHRMLFTALSAASAGLAVATKPVFLLLLPAIALAILYKRETARAYRRELLLGAVAFGIPILLWVFTQFYHVDSLRNILAFYSNPYEVADVSAKIFRNIVRLFGDITPLFLAGTMILWFASLLVRYRRRERIGIEEVLSVIFVFLSVAAYLRTGGWYRYLFPYQVIVLFFTPNAIAVLVEELHRRFPLSALRSKGLMLLVSGALLFFFGAYLLLFNSWAADSYESRKTAFWQDYFSSAPAERVFFFYDTPEVALFAEGRTYYQYLTPKGWTSDTRVLEKLRSGVADTVIVKTDALPSTGDLFAGYAKVEEVYKYTVLANEGALP